MSVFPTVEDACGAGTSDENLTAGDYITIIADAVEDMADAGVSNVIPDDQIDTVCEVMKHEKSDSCVGFVWRKKKENKENIEIETRDKMTYNGIIVYCCICVCLCFFSSCWGYMRD